MTSASISTKHIMPNVKIFFDSSALVAGIISASGAARALLQLAEIEELDVVINEQVITEGEYPVILYDNVEIKKIPPDFCNESQNGT